MRTASSVPTRKRPDMSAGSRSGTAASSSAGAIARRQRAQQRTNRSQPTSRDAARSAGKSSAPKTSRSPRNKIWSASSCGAGLGVTRAGKRAAALIATTAPCLLPTDLLANCALASACGTLPPEQRCAGGPRLACNHTEAVGGGLRCSARGPRRCHVTHRHARARAHLPCHVCATRNVGPDSREGSRSIRRGAPRSQVRLLAPPAAAGRCAALLQCHLATAPDDAMEHSTTSVQALLACSSNRDLLFVQTDLLKRFDDQFSLLCDAGKLAEEQKDESKARSLRARLLPQRSRPAPAGQGAARAG